MRILVWTVAALMLISCGDSADPTKKDPVQVSTDESESPTTYQGSQTCDQGEEFVVFDGEDRCMTACTVDTDCDANEECMEFGICFPRSETCESPRTRILQGGDYHCVLPCYDDNDDEACDSGTICDLDLGYCVSDEGDFCQTRADCTANAECVEGRCRPHLYCSYAYEREIGYDVCKGEWRGCEDGKEYEIRCEETSGLRCTCAVNDVETSVVELSGDCYDFDHRLANEVCGWVLPELR